MIITGVCTGLSIYLLSGISHHVRLVDEPGGRKQHDAVTSVVGGIGIVTGFLTLAFTQTALFVEYKMAWAAMLVLMCVGILDDIRHVNNIVRFLIQVSLACIVFYLADLKFLSLGDIWGIGDLGLGPLAVVFTCIAVVGGINAVNMMDGLDGLCGGLMAVTLGFLAIMAFLAGHNTVLTVSLLMLTAVGVFLLFNFRLPWNGQARIFLGDSGTYALGFMVVVLFLMASQGSDRFLQPITALWLMAIPLVDIAQVMLRRGRKGVMPMEDDREHIHYVLVDWGLPVETTVNVLCIAAIIVGGFGVLLHYTGVSELWSWMLFMIFCAAYFWIISRIRTWPKPVGVSNSPMVKSETSS